VEAFRDFSDWLKRLKEASSRYPVLVEGRRDAEALKRFGVRNVITLAGRRFADIADFIESRSEGAILLYDLDPHGEKGVFEE